ncbi:hypothetical protein DFP73DRAFT_155486 [Morchella snyderi]|nr:hypothetical protein DFP73DRAFT_155486 [Morchella snyderi]
MSLSTDPRSTTTTTTTTITTNSADPASPPNIIPHRRLSRKRIPSPPRNVIDFAAFESSRVPQLSLHTYPSTSSLADLYASHGRMTPGRRSPMLTAVIPASQANIHLPPTPPSGSGGEGDDDEGGVPLSLDFDGVFGTSPRNRRVLRRVKANIHDVSPSLSGSAPMSAASDSTTTLSSPPTPPKEQAIMALHHPRPLSKSPKSAYFQDSLLVAAQMQQAMESGIDAYHRGAGVSGDYHIVHQSDPRFEGDERDEEPFEVRRAESIKVTKAESIKVRKVEELDMKRAEEIEAGAGKVEEPETGRIYVQLEPNMSDQLDADRDNAPIQVSTTPDSIQPSKIGKEEPKQPPSSNSRSLEPGEQLRLIAPTPTLEAVVFSESEFDTATEGDDDDYAYGGSDAGTIVIKLQTTVQEQKLREEEEVRRQEDATKRQEAEEANRRKQEANRLEEIARQEELARQEAEHNADESEDEELAQHPIIGKEGRKPTPWPTPRVNSYASSLDIDRRAETGSPLSEDGDLEFHDALSSPLASPIITPREEELALPNLTPQVTPKKKSEFVISFGPTPTRSNPGDPSPSTNPVLPQPPQNPSPPGPPVLNIIPATPMPLMSPSAMQEKQLGHSMPLLERRSTEIPTLITTSPTLPLAAPLVPPRLKKAQRPSLLSQPKRMRESKLHPWWRPRLENGEDEGLSRSFTTQTQASEFSVSNSGVPEKPDGKRGGRVTKKIKGTKFQIEFIGLGTLREKVKVAGEKTSGLGRRMSLRKKA